MFDSPVRSSLDSLDLPAISVWGFGIVGGATAAFMGVGALLGRDRELAMWAVLGALLVAGAGIQLWRRKPDAGLLVMVVAIGAVPVAAFGSGEGFPVMMAVVLLMAVVVVLVEADRRRKVLRLAVVYGSAVVATLAHARARGGPTVVSTVVLGSSVLAVAFIVTVFVFATSARVAEYDHSLHRALFESARDGVVVVDTRGTIVRANRAAEAMFGFEPGEMVGRSVSDLLVPAYRALHERQVAGFMGQVEAGARPMRDGRVLEAMRRWGETFPAEISIASFEVGGERMAAATVRDVSRRVRAEKEARQGLELYRELYERMPAALYRTTPDGRIVEGNRALAALLGARTVENLRDVSITSLFVDSEEREQAVAQMADGSGESVFRIRTLDGRMLWVRDHGRAITDEAGEIVAYEGAVEDITERMEAVVALEELADVKQRLIAAIAHNLRTPLTIVLGYASLLKEGSAGGEDVEELASLVWDHAYELATLVDEVVLASRLYGDGEGVLIVKGQQVPIDDAVASALQALGGGRRAARVRVIRSGLSVRGDTLRVRQVVQLMLSHVLRTGGGEVLVKAEPIGSERIGVVVSHPGPPVPAPEREEMFEPFTADGSDPFRPGRLNVGLWAARRLALLMGGELGYDHRDGYSRFELTLPAASTRRETA